METFLAYLDQFRYMAGSLGMCMLLCRGALPRREPFRPRAAAAWGVCLLLAFAYVPLSRALSGVRDSHPMIIAPYWTGMSFVLVGFVLFCYETSLPGALFRAMMTAFTENIVTVLIRNLLVYTFFPAFPKTRPALYVLCMAAVYGGFFHLADKTLGKMLRSDELNRMTRGRGTTAGFMILYLSFTALLSTSKYVMETLILPLKNAPALLDTYRHLQLYLVGVMLLLSVMMTTMVWYIYQHFAMRTEKEVLLRLARDKRSQYEFSRENIEMINRKTHDLKHQLQALALVSDEERKRQIQETSRAIDFYDAVVKTGNEALDILLTEKNVYCANRHIRLSCMVDTGQLGKIGTVDLYTLLGNALDNAIESVERIEDPERKVISLSILDRGSMLYIQLENYYEGAVDFRDGLPKTRKKDPQDHGYGLKSIRSIVLSYGGKLGIRTEDGVFYLEIIIP